MALFLMDHSVTKIMLLGRWSSDAFLNYIRPQVLEWTNQLSRDMITTILSLTSRTPVATLQTPRGPVVVDPWLPDPLMPACTCITDACLFNGWTQKIRGIR